MLGWKKKNVSRECIVPLNPFYNGVILAKNLKSLDSGSIVVVMEQNNEPRPRNS